MENKGLTLSIIFEAESANYGESFGNISSLKKLSRGDGNSYSYISRQALRYNIINQLGWDNTKVSNADKVVQFEKDASIKEYPEIDFFGYMKTGKNSVNGSSNTRNAVVRLSNAVALESYNSDLDFLTNMALAKRGAMDNAIAQSEIHKSYYAYTITIDLDKVGIDEIIKDKENNKETQEIDNKEKAKRVKELLKILKTLYRDIRGRRENLSPLFIIGGVYNIKNPFFENRLKVNKNNLEIKTIKDVLDLDSEIKSNTICGLVDSIFSNTEDIKKELDAKTVSYFIDELSKKVDEYYV
ncbi:type I-B CRISPR-associated protein Cas7/Cst2/DevR [Brachyspira sp. G79]|uniref:type I-B CRISPR-associated protein Cas7/Cst2/DevR n=1 Tax=Brachyspira sp. G79 TaxID=1358104 RepID=UPI000BBC09A3|nr:type I-B CRISPR-associated protein Cas7/Cst2/DevR [Brachyspira sp. G79]PCG20684.1 CRISPR-associated protein [Brachyspira sp. G79]